MATRAAWLTPAHVEALNAVPIEFHGRKRALRTVLDNWKTYIDHLSQAGMPADVWAQKRVDLFVDLLHSMSTLLSYNFSRVEISREVYHPQGHVQIESDQTIIRQGLAKLFRGEAAIPMDVKSFAVDPAIVARQTHLQTALIEWLNGDRQVKVVLDSVRGQAERPDQQSDRGRG
jgi:hypothetical protein